MFLLFDGRARGGDTDEATCFLCAETEEECRETGSDYGDDAIWFEQKVEGGPLEMRPDLSPVLRPWKR